MLKTGTIVGKRYRIRHLLAEGGMAEVYLAESIMPDDEHRFFALKRQWPHLSRNTRFSAMFKAEAQLALSLEHRSVVQAYELFHDGSDIFLPMEFILGKEVGALLAQSKKKPPAQRLMLAIAVGLGVCESFAYFHDERGPSIVHGDISPQNIMITVDGVVKVYDFGAAKKNTRKACTIDDIVRGNLHYMSPEHRGGSALSTASDIYSLTLILLEIFLGRTVAIHRTKFPLQEKDLKNTLDDLPDGMTQHVIKFFNQGLARDPEQRFSSSNIMREQLLSMASMLQLENPEKFLQDIMAKTEPLTNISGASRVLSSSRPYVISLSFAALCLGLSVWALVAVFASVFEPNPRYNLPFWPKEIAHPEMVASTVVAEKPEVLQLHVEKTARKTGTLHVHVKPWAEVYVDGDFIGRTPMEGVNLTVGQHVVQLRNPELSAVMLRMIKIYADKKTEIAHNF